jgi:AmiR/NasT family two-component response regulator
MIVWGAIALPDEPCLATPRGHHVAILSFDAAPLWTEAERMRNHPTISRASSPRWRVALLGETLQARASLAEAIHSVGGTVVLVRVSASETLDDLNRARPDVAIVAPQPLWHGGALLLRLRDQASCPVVLLAQTPSRRLLDEALEAGVMGCLIEPVRAVQLASTLDLAVARFREMQGLRQALADRKVIEKAKGLLMSREGLTEDEAFRRLRRSSMDTQRSLADTARAVLSAEVVAASV